MFKNAERDPLAIPSRGARRPSMGPTRRTAAGEWRTNPLIPYGHAWSDEHQRFMPEEGYDPATKPAVDPRPSPLMDAVDRHYNGDGYDAAAEEEMFRRHQERGGEGTPDPRDFHANLPRPVAKVLDREARAFMEREGNTDDRSELLYRARRHASNLTSTWSRDASEKVTQAFCGRVAALIPSRPRVAAAQPVTEFADFDDSLLY